MDRRTRTIEVDRARVRPARRASDARRRQLPASNPTVDDVLGWLQRTGSKRQVRELERYGITATDPYGVSVGALRRYAKPLGTDRELAQALWASGRYEACMLATMLDDPARVTKTQMNAWARDFDSWALVDTACFELFDKSKHAWAQAERWSVARPEFTKRAGFALVWALSVHAKSAPDAPFETGLGWIERAATDDRHFVKKAVNMALRALGKRNPSLHAAALRTADRLGSSTDPTARWIGSHAARELRSAKVVDRLAKKARGR